MGQTLIHQRPIQAIENELLQAGLEWHRNSGRISSDRDRWFEPIQEHIQISVDNHEQWPPPYLFLGPKSTMVTMLGPEYARELVGCAGLPDTEAESRVNARYRWVSAGEGPCFDTISCTMRLPPDWRLVGVEYDRLILPTELSNGTKTFSVFTAINRQLDLVGSEILR